MTEAQLGLRQIAIYAQEIGLELLSPEKLMDWLVQQIVGEQQLERLGKRRPALKHIKRDTRRRKSTITTGLKALS